MTGTPLALGRTRDPLGRVTVTTENGLGGTASSAAAYDPLGQLATTGPAANDSDVAGSPTTVNGVAQTFNLAMALTARATRPEATTLTSSARGERTQQTAANGSLVGYRYDQESRLTNLWSVAGPRVTGLSATSGISTGGNTVTVSGSGFASGARVYFGDRAATTTVVSSTTLTAVVPTGSGAVDVTVQTLLGRSAPVAAGRYTYQKPAVTALSPSSGLAAGGQTVVIRGWNLTGASSVEFGSKAASFTVNSAEQITAITPASTGTVNVVVTTGQGTSTTGPATTFRYHAEPIITSVSPPAGRTAGGIRVTIRGSNLIGVTAVRFGSRAGTSVRVSSSTTLTAVTPSGSGVVHVTATSAKGTSATSNADLYGYAAGPAVLAVSPGTIPAVGGTTITITGAGFTSASSVKVGGVAASKTFVSSTSLKARAPAGSGVAHVVVSNGTVASPQIPKDQVTFLRPAVSSLSLNQGPAAGGQRITVTGSRLTGATKVLFGVAAGTSLTVAGSSSLSVTAPAGTGSVDIRVVTPEGTSLPVTADRYTYTTAPMLSGLSSRILRGQGDDSLTLTGWNLSGLTEVAFGTTRVPVEEAGNTTATVRTPAGTGVATVTAYADTTAAISTSAQQVVYSEVDERYTYDGAGLRQNTTSIGGASRPAVWDPFASQPALLIDGNTRLINGPGDLPVAQVDTADRPLYYLHDDRGSTRALLDGTGGTAATFAYSAYGQITARTGNVLPTVTYAGGVQDDSGLIYLINRHLDPTTGTFLTVDPATSLTGQPYAYAGGDPLNAVDRQGLFAIPLIAVGAVIGAVAGAVSSTVSHAVTSDDHSLTGFLGAAVGGAVSGSISGACMGSGAGVVLGTVCDAAAGAAGSVVEQWIANEHHNVDWAEVRDKTVVSVAGGRISAGLGSLVGQDVLRGSLRSTTVRYGGLKINNFWQPGAITSKFYGSTAIGAVVGFNLDLAKEIRDGLTDIYRYRQC